MSEERVAVDRTVFIAAAPETLFGFLVDPALMGRWIGMSHTLEPTPGGTFRVEMADGNVAVGVFIEITPCRRVAFTWGWESEDSSLAKLKPGTSLVEIDLEAKGDGTLLRLRHEGLPEDLQGIHGDRWSHYLNRLGRVALASTTLDSRDGNKC